MKSGIDVFIALIILTILALVGASFLSANATTMRARDAQASYVTEIEDSNFAPSVIEACKNNAAKCGFKDLEVDINTGRVVLVYEYSMPILNVKNEHSIISYAR